MLARHLKSPLLAVAIALAAGAANCYAGEPIVESFERMLAHDPNRAPVAAPAQPADPLVAALVTPLRDGFPRTPVCAGDPVGDSFARMLAHTPNPVSPPLPASSGSDPLIAAMVGVMRQGRGEGEATTHYAMAQSQRNVR